MATVKEDVAVLVDQLAFIRNDARLLDAKRDRLLPNERPVVGPGCLYFTIDGGEVGAGPVGALSATTRAITLIGAARRELATATRAFRPRRYGS